MGYQQVKKPRFFIDMMTYLHAIGNEKYFIRNDVEHSDWASIEQIHYGEKLDLLYCNPTSIIKFSEDQPNFGGDTLFNYRDHVGGETFPVLPIDCLVCLNHNLEGMRMGGGSHLEWTFFEGDELINWKNTIEYNGFSIRLKSTPVYTSADTERLYCYFDHRGEGNVGQRYMGSYFYGKTWSPPHNPNLSMKLTRDFDGIKSTKTKLGYTTTDVDYLGSPLWSGHNPFELWKYYPYDPIQKYLNENPDETQQQMFVEDRKANLGRLGRRRWNLTWDLVSESDLFNSLELSNLNNIFDGSGDYTGMDNPFQEEESFISRVWTPTLGGNLKFLLQLDDQNNNPDQFVIAKFRKDSLSITPKAPSLYTFSIDIEEV